MATPYTVTNAFHTCYEERRRAYNGKADEAGFIAGMITGISNAAFSFYKLYRVELVEWESRGGGLKQLIKPPDAIAYYTLIGLVGSAVLGVLVWGVVYFITEKLQDRSLARMRNEAPKLGNGNRHITSQETRDVMAKLAECGRVALMSFMNSSQLAASCQALGHEKFVALLKKCHSRREIEIWKGVMDLPQRVSNPEDLKKILNAPLMNVQNSNSDYLLALLTFYKGQPDYEEVIFRSLLQRHLQAPAREELIEVTIGEERKQLNFDRLRQCLGIFHADFSEQKDKKFDLTLHAAESEVEPKDLMAFLSILSGEETSITRQQLLECLKVSGALNFDSNALFLDAIAASFAEEMGIEGMARILVDNQRFSLLRQQLLAELQANPKLSNKQLEALAHLGATADAELATFIVDQLYQTNIRVAYGFSDADPELKEKVLRQIRINPNQARQAWPIEEAPEEVAAIIYS